MFVKNNYKVFDVASNSIVFIILMCDYRALVPIHKIVTLSFMQTIKVVRNLNVLFERCRQLFSNCMRLMGPPTKFREFWPATPPICHPLCSEVYAVTEKVHSYGRG